MQPCYHAEELFAASHQLDSHVEFSNSIRGINGLTAHPRADAPSLSAPEPVLEHNTWHLLSRRCSGTFAMRECSISKHTSHENRYTLQALAGSMWPSSWLKPHET